jgi:hypothetical protein
MEFKYTGSANNVNVGIAVNTTTVWQAFFLAGAATIAQNTLWINGSNVGPAQPSLSGTNLIIAMAVDFTAKLIWFKVGSNSWNNNALANLGEPRYRCWRCRYFGDGHGFNFVLRSLRLQWR